MSHTNGLYSAYTGIFLRVQLASLVLSEPQEKRAHLGFRENLEVLAAKGSLETLDLPVTLETKVNRERTDCRYVIPFLNIKLSVLAESFCVFVNHSYVKLKRKQGFSH